MRKQILIISITAMTLLLLGCPMPQMGGAPTRDLTGSEAAPGTPAAGSISVVNDAARGVAVYTNESGQQFDVAAAEYDGGPLVKCVDVADFSLVPSSTDSDALPVKALVVGTRDDGMPGVWQINSDDTITLPQPEVTTDNAARCIVGSDMSTLPGSVQTRHGWTFTVDSMSADGQFIAGHAVNRNGVVIGGVPIASGSTIGVYWRAYPLPFTRYVVVSQPRIIGTFVKPPLPPSWTPRPTRFTAILATMKQFFVGTLEAYISLPDARDQNGNKVQVLRFGTQGNYSYLVKGINEFGDHATAFVEKSGNVTVAAVPDLILTSVSVAADPTAAGQWVASATVTDDSSGGSKGFALSYRLVNQADGSSIVIGTSTNSAGLAGMESVTDNLAFTPTPGTYTVVAKVTAVDQDYEFDTLNNSTTSAPFTVAGTGTGTANLVVDGVSPLTTGTLGTSADWPITATVQNTGSVSSSGGYVVRFAVSNAYSGSTVNVDATIATPLAAGDSFTVTALNLDRGTTLAQNGVGSGTNTVTVSVIDQVDRTSDTFAQSATVPVFYPGLIVETYYALGANFTGNFYMDLFGSDGDNAGSSYNLWSSTVDQGVAIAWSVTSYDFDQSGFPYINHTGNIAPNSDFYVRIRGNNPDYSSAYAIRVSTGLLPLLGDDPNWYFGSENPADVADQAKPSVGGIGVPSVLPQNVIVVSATPYASRLNRYIHGGTELDADVDWVKIHLP